MKDNTIRFPSNFEPDPNDPNNRHLEDALNPTETDVSVMHPVELWVDRDFLIAEVQISLATLREKYDPVGRTSAERTYLAAMIQQRVEFLEYLNTQTDDRVYIAMYPVGSEPQLGLGESVGFETDDDLTGDTDFGDLGIDDESGDLPL